MNSKDIVRIPTILCAMLCCGLVPAALRAQSVTELEDQAEAYLKQCELDKPLKLWQEILASDPEHRRAGFVVSRLSLGAVDLDSHLQVIETLIDKGITKGTDSLLESAARKAGSDSRKARILYLHGRLVCRMSDEARSRAGFQTAVKLYPDTAWGARSAIALAETPWANRLPGQPERLLRGVMLNEKLNKAVRQEANFKLLLIQSAGWTSQRRVAALRGLLATITEAAVRRQILETIVDSVIEAQGKWVPEAVEAAGAFLQAAPTYDQAGRMLTRLSRPAVDSQDSGTLDTLLKVLGQVKLNDATLAGNMAIIRVEGIIGRGIVEEDTAAMTSFLDAAAKALDELAADEKMPSGHKRIWQLRGRLYLAKAQKLAALAGTTEALPAIMMAKNHYLAGLPTDPQGCLRRLEKIGILLEHVQERETAATLYREVVDAFPHMPQGSAALLKIARLYEQRLNAPTAALEVYAEYAAKYPADLPYRQLDLGRRLHRLGYANLLDFQKRTGLEPDGVFGPQTRRKLAEVESGFDVISAHSKAAAGILRGKFVHPTMFRIARKLERTGRHYEAIQAYLLLLNLFPTKSQADDALLGVARLFRDNMLFEEALGAYGELMEYFPKPGLFTKH